LNAVFCLYPGYIAIARNASLLLGGAGIAENAKTDSTVPVLRTIFNTWGGSHFIVHSFYL